METPWKILGLVYVLVTSACIFLFEGASEWASTSSSLAELLAALADVNPTLTVTQDLKHTTGTEGLQLLKVSSVFHNWLTWNWVSWVSCPHESSIHCYLVTPYCSLLLELNQDLVDCHIDAWCLSGLINNKSPNSLTKRFNSYLSILHHFAITGSQ